MEFEFKMVASASVAESGGILVWTCSDEAVSTRRPSRLYIYECTFGKTMEYAFYLFRASSQGKRADLANALIFSTVS